MACVVLYAGLNATAQKSTDRSSPKQIAAAEKEVMQFYESYAEDLRQHRREAIGDRYDRRGTYFMGNGRKYFDTFDAVKARYLMKWNGPKSFEWRDLAFEILSPTIAVVVGRFEWSTAEGTAMKYSYTGVLVKRDGQWRIRVEDESRGL
jgi:hypothetical protein